MLIVSAAFNPGKQFNATLNLISALSLVFIFLSRIIMHIGLIENFSQYIRGTHIETCSINSSTVSVDVSEIALNSLKGI